MKNSMKATVAELPSKPWFSVAELAQIFGLHVDTILAMANEGSLPRYRIGKRVYRFKYDDVKRFLQSRRVETAV
jgi:excisionase family DNA binding protein